ncbi:trafficking protein particle complex subunit 6B [Moelleriella libera RCEF 2490]|uniref:Trafficking protein particle complex subunit 6B n=1 Tax=Moelleriella libera RCEF 2490 TaxID=1081109 RepID=A0A162IAF7_9HYPO|nr:trafficking protein particle complex subunit 6B [Moelleriella libera RCEF 2490]
MSLEPVMPPYNFTDPSATFLSSSCLDFLLIELVPLAHRVTNECDSSPSSRFATESTAQHTTETTNRAVSSGSLTCQGSAAEARKLDDEEERDAVHFRLDALGYRVGQGLVERYGFCLSDPLPLCGQ